MQAVGLPQAGGSGDAGGFISTRLNDGLDGRGIFRDCFPLSRLRRALKQPHDPSPDWRKTLPVSCSGMLFR